jgi:hypothetical protein
MQNRVKISVKAITYSTMTKVQGKTPNNAKDNAKVKDIKEKSFRTNHRQS